jgi:16S rRNA (guanine966-N2)-methyltransferase
MRIEGGELRGRIITAPHGNATRPTDGRTREMLFNSLGEFIVGARVLDLYAGSGSVGLEALSRGAESCVFVEQEHAATQTIKKNLKIFNLESKGQVWAGNARSAVAKLDDNGERFDFIFADPPFTLVNEGEEIAKRLDSHCGLLNNVSVGNETEPDSMEDSQRQTLIVIQHSRRVTLPTFQNLVLKRQKRAGESMLSFLIPQSQQ